MSSSKAETTINIWFSVPMLVAGTYIVSHTCLWKILRLVAAVIQEKKQLLKHNMSLSSDVIQCYLHEILSF